MRCWFRRWVWIPAAALAVLCPASDRIPVTFIVENYVWAHPTERGVQNRMSWIEGRAVLNDRVRLIGSYIDRPTGKNVTRSLDETFVEVTQGPSVIRLGRFRPRFGFGDWSELLYTPIIRLPMARTGALTPTLSLTRQDTGIDVATFFGNFDLQVGFTDASNDGWQFLPKKLDHGTARLQMTLGDLMVGLNATSKFGSESDKRKVAGVDVRWSNPHVQVRGEFVKGIGKSPNAEGAYLDVFYRPEQLHRTQFGARLETFQFLNGKRAHLQTLAVRQILCKELTLSVNYGWGNDVGPAFVARGWSAQLMTAIKF